MQVFITGGTGYIGSALIPLLLHAGHSVTCLARSAETASHVEALGCTPVRGTQLDLSVLASAASQADAIIHLAFDHHDLARFPQTCAEDRAAISAMCSSMGRSRGGSDKPFICASGTFLTDGETEDSPKVPDERLPRWKSEVLTLDYAKSGVVRGMAIRFAPVVHDLDNIHVFISPQIDGARKAGVAGYIGQGDQRWPACHVTDAVECIMLMLEKGEGGRVYNAVAEEGIPIKVIAETIAKKLGMGTESLSREQAGERYGGIAHLMEMDNKTTSIFTRKALGWEPKGRGLIEDMEDYEY